MLLFSIFTMERKSIYEIRVVQSDNDLFKTRRYPRFDVVILDQILYYSKKTAEKYIKHVVEKAVYDDLICFIVTERPMDALCVSEDDGIWVYDQYGEDVSSASHQVGDIVDVLRNDEIVLGFVTEVLDNGYIVLSSSSMKSRISVDARHIFNPHFKISVRTERRLKKAIEHSKTRIINNIWNNKK